MAGKEGVQMAKRQHTAAALEFASVTAFTVLKAMKADKALAGDKDLQAAAARLEKTCALLNDAVKSGKSAGPTDKGKMGDVKKILQALSTDIQKLGPKLKRENVTVKKSAAKGPVDAGSYATVASMALGLDKKSTEQIRQARIDRIKKMSAAAGKFDFSSAAKYADALRDTLRKMSKTTLGDATQHSRLAVWLEGLPDQVDPSVLGLEYTADQVNMMWIKGQRIMQLMVGDGDMKAWMTDMEANVKKSTEARMKASGASDKEIKKEVEDAIADYKSRFQVKEDTSWLKEFYSRKIPVPLAFDYLLATFIYTVDAKICSCKSLEECKKKPKTHKTKPQPPEFWDAHGGNSAMWAVTNWAIRVQADTDVKPETRKLCDSVLEVFQVYHEALDDALECLPNNRRVVFRGLPVAIARAYRLNTEVILAPFTSTSMVGEEALKFMDASKPGTFFIMRMHSASKIDFMSWYPEQAEALLGRCSKFLCKQKTSRTVLRMLQCKFDIVTLVEVGGDNDNQGIVDALVGSAKHTVFIYKNYLRMYVESRVMIGLLQDKNKSAPKKMLSVVGDWLNKETGHAVLFGDGGTGKTSATLAVQSFLTGQNVFTVFIPLPTVVGGPTKAGAMDSFVLNSLDLNKAQFELLVKQHKVVLLLDSLDECGSVNPANICTGLVNVNPLCAKARIVLSCRTEMVVACQVQDERKIIDNTLASKVATWSVSSFTEDDVAEFINKSAPGAGVNAKDLLKKFPEEVTQHPLRLQMLVEILKSPGGKDKFKDDNLDVADVYQAYIAEKIKQAAGPAKLTEDQLLHRLTQVGWQMLRSGQWLVSVEEAQAHLKCDPACFVDLPVRVEDHDDKKSPFTFWHRSIGEFLVALQITKEPKISVEKQLKGIHSQRQIGCLRFLLSMGDGSTQEDAVDQLLHHCGAPHSVLGFLREKLASLEKVHGKDSYKVVTTLGNLGSALGSIGQNHEKKDVLMRVLALKEKKWGNDHINLANTLNDLGNAIGQLGDEQGKLKYLDRCLKLKEREYGNDDYRLATTLNNLGNVHGALGDNKKKIELLDRAYALKVKKYGKDSIELASTLNNLGNAWGDEGDHKKKIELLNRSLQLKESQWGADHFECASTLNNLGNAYGQLGDQEKKRDLMKRSLVLKERHYGPNNYNCASTLHNLGRCYGRLNQNTEFRDTMLRAVKLKQAHYGKTHKECKGSLEELQKAYTALGQTEDAKRIKAEIDAIKK